VHAPAIVLTNRDRIRGWLTSLETLAADDPDTAREELRETPTVALIAAAHACCRLEMLDGEMASGLRVLLLDDRVSLTPDALPAELIDTWITQLRDTEVRWPRHYVEALLDWMSRHPEIPRRVQVTEVLPHVANEAPDIADLALQRLVDDQVVLVSDAASSALPAAIERTPACKQSEMTASWSMSRSPAHRAALAGAIASGLDGVGVPTALEHLATDSHTSVRRSAVEAASQRAGDFPEHARVILDRGVRDPSPEVRYAARRGLRSQNEPPQGDRDVLEVADVHGDG